MMPSISRPYSIGDEMIDEYGAVGGMRTDRGDRSTWRKPAPVTLSTADPTLPDLGSNSGHHGGKLVTDCLSYGMTSKCLFSSVLWFWRFEKKDKGSCT
jgi:hypothetical protein